MKRFERLLVTGASGQLGRRLVRELWRRKYQIKAHYRSEQKAARYCPDGVARVFGDITNPDWLAEAVKDCDLVIHCAAWVSVRPLDQRDTEYMYRVNVEGTRAVVDACRRAGVKRLLHVSSVAGLGASPDGIPLDETAQFNLGGYGLPYCDTKHEAEVLALAANGQSLEVVAVNPSIMISLPDREITERDRKKIPKWLPVYFDFGLNLVETSDVIEGLITAAEKGRPGERYLLTGENIDPQKAFSLAGKYFGIKNPLLKLPFWLIYIAGAIAEIMYLFKRKKPKLNRNIARLLKLKFYYNHEKARRELGFEPKGLEAIIKNIVPVLHSEF